MYIMKLNLGDWSNDGHGMTSARIYKVNHPVEVVQQAYKDSCKLTGIQFNLGEDYTGGKSPLNDRQNKIATDYLDNRLSDDVCNILSSFGIYASEYADGLFVDSFSELWWEFVKISKKDIEYEEVEIPSINGVWNENLNVQFGYGLF